MLKVRILGSGSGGNATFVSSGKTHLIIDCGLSARRIAQDLSDLGLALDQLDGILISHEHTDHIKGLPTLLRNRSLPLFLNDGTATGSWCDPEWKRRPFSNSEAFQLGDLEIEPFSVPHDAADPCGFLIRCRGVQLAHVTDLGVMTELVRQRLRGSHGLVIESNHDEEMLKVGPYPWPLKQRVLSRVGHLSNRALAEFLENDFDGGADHVILAHLSQQNNHPELALGSAQDAIARRTGAARSCRLILAGQFHATPVITIE